MGAPLAAGEEAKTRDDSSTWLAKKWSVQILHRVFQRYNNIHYMKDHYIQIC